MRDAGIRFHICPSDNYLWGNIGVCYCWISLLWLLFMSFYSFLVCVRTFLHCEHVLSRFPLHYDHPWNLHENLLVSHSSYHLGNYFKLSMICPGIMDVKLASSQNLTSFLCKNVLSKASGTSWNKTVCNTSLFSTVLTDQVSSTLFLHHAWEVQASHRNQHIDRVFSWCDWMYQ